MSHLTLEECEGLLHELSQMGSAGRAENEDKDRFPRTYYPVPEHSKVLDPDVVLIVGDRGAGKSELFRAINSGLVGSIARGATATRLPPVGERTTWRAGFPLHTDFPDQASLRAFAAAHESDRDATQELWFAYLTRVLLALDPAPPDEFNHLRLAPGGALDIILEQFRSQRQQALLYVDTADRRARDQDRWMFVSYDELDTIAGSAWTAMGTIVRGLVSFWANYARRWQRIRAKIFLRTDIFRRHTEILGADISKLAANRAELSWSDRHLYAMLAKRIANTSRDLLTYCQAARIRGEDDKQLGWIPSLARSDDARPFIERLAGKYMGANMNKGATFYWLLDHLRDGRNKIAPRALVRLIEKSASHELDVRRATPPRLLHHTSIRRALDDVSREHVLEVNTSELPWLPGVRDRIRRQLVPLGRREAEKLLERDFDEPWGDDDSVHPPAGDAHELVEYLLELGVLRERSDGRLDCPDLYRAGLELQGKGGVARA